MGKKNRAVDAVVVELGDWANVSPDDHKTLSEVIRRVAFLAEEVRRTAGTTTTMDPSITQPLNDWDRRVRLDPGHPLHDAVYALLAELPESEWCLDCAGNRQFAHEGGGGWGELVDLSRRPVRTTAELDDKIDRMGDRKRKFESWFKDRYLADIDLESPSESAPWFAEWVKRLKGGVSVILTGAKRASDGIHPDGTEPPAKYRRGNLPDGDPIGPVTDTKTRLGMALRRKEGLSDRTYSGNFAKKVKSGFIWARHADGGKLSVFFMSFEERNNVQKWLDEEPTEAGGSQRKPVRRNRVRSEPSVLE
jgi:hypothetical protein